MFCCVAASGCGFADVKVAGLVHIGAYHCLPCSQLANIINPIQQVAPWSKTGGLGDVMGALPQALAARGHRVMVVSARHTNGGADEARYAGLRRAAGGERRCL